MNIDSLSKRLLILLEISTNCAAQHLLLSVSAMVSAYRAFSWPQTLRQLVFCIFAHVISVALSFVAWLAKMSIAPTEPLSHITTELAFELDVFLTMLRAVLDGYLAAIGTDELLCVEVSTCLLLVHCSHAVLSASEVRFLAFVALKVCINSHSVLFRFAVIG